jgi:hypothetical protein
MIALSVCYDHILIYDIRKIAKPGDASTRRARTAEIPAEPLEYFARLAVGARAVAMVTGKRTVASRITSRYILVALPQRPHSAPRAL